MTDVAPTGGGHAHPSGSGMGKKLGPLPIWAWAVVLVGAYLLYKYLHDKAAASATISTPDSGTDTSGGGSNAGSGSGGTNADTTTTPLTATGWIYAATSFLQNLGYSTSSIDTAMQDWTSGSPLTSTDIGILDAAVNGTGAPPAGLPNITLGTSGSTVSSPSPPSTPSPAVVGPTAPTEATAPALSLPSGDSIIGDVVAVFQDGAGWTYVTNKGYVYNQGGSNYFGGTNGGEVGGVPGSNIVNAIPITSGADAGGYTLYNAAGQTYTFGPTNNAATGQYATAAA